MKKLSLLLVVLSLFVAAQAYAENIKIGSVDLIKALNESDAGKKAKTDLESLIKTKQASLDEKGKSIEKMKGDIEKQSSVLSADARKSKEDELEKVIRDYQRLVGDSQGEIKKKEGEFTKEIIKELREIIAKIGTEGGYTIILEGSDGQILYAQKEIDLTDLVIKKHNEMKAAPKK
ncbi:MAG: OmpH family outer membrane protein [Nitrospiraceae bacterium]|jgi:outer membrane protein|nr:MAG: OmpH family outer membrane protein [Nitrospiraceae bacterium]